MLATASATWVALSLENFKLGVEVCLKKRVKSIRCRRGVVHETLMQLGTHDGLLAPTEN